MMVMAHPFLCLPLWLIVRQKGQLRYLRDRRILAERQQRSLGRAWQRKVETGREKM